MVQNPVYKGEYIANRVEFHEKYRKLSKDGLRYEFVKREIPRDESEWIRVNVPAIVSEDIWQRANDMVDKNKAMARRNQKHDYLLSGLVKCAECGYAISGKSNRRKNPKRRDYYGYMCSTRIAPKSEGRVCSQGYVLAKKLDDAIWSTIVDLLLNPEQVIRALEANMFGEQNQELSSQLEYLERELKGKQGEDEKLYRAYMADVFDETEYKARRDELKAEIDRLQREIEKLRPRKVTREQFEAEKQQILDLSDHLHKTGVSQNEVPFELKRRILKLVVDNIKVNIKEGWFTLSGSIAPLPITTIFACENKPASPT